MSRYIHVLVSRFIQAPLASLLVQKIPKFSSIREKKKKLVDREEKLEKNGENCTCRTRLIVNCVTYFTSMDGLYRALSWEILVGGLYYTAFKTL